MFHRCLSKYIIILAFLTCASLSRAEELSFTNDVLPILQKNCLACHNESEYEGELVMESVELLLDGGDSGPAVIPGKADESLIYQLATHEEEPAMPPEDNDVGAERLTEAQLDIIKKWINAGAKDEANDSSARPEIQWKPIPDKFASIVATEVSPDGRWLATGRGNQLRVYSLQEKTLQQKLVDENIAQTHPESAHLDSVQSIAWSHDQQWLASGGFRVVKIWQRVALEGSQEEAEATHDQLRAKLDNENSIAKLFHTEDEKEIAQLNAKLILDELLARERHQLSLLEQKLTVLKADVETAKKRKTSAENDVKKAGEEIKKSEESVKKETEALKKNEEKAEQKQKQTTDIESKFSTLEKKLKELGEKIASAEDEQKAKLNAEKTKSEQELNKIKGERDKLRKERDAAKQEVEKTKKSLADAKKSVERSKNAKVRLEKTVVEKAADIKTAEEIASQHGDTVKEAQTDVEAKQKETPSPWQHVAFDGDSLRCVNRAGQSATFTLDGQLVGIDANIAGKWELIQTIGGPNEDTFVDRVTSLAFRPDGKVLAIGGGEPSRSGELQLWNTSDWTRQASVKDVHSDVVYDLQFAPLGGQLVSCASDRLMKLIDSNESKILRTFEGHTGHVLGVSWRADGRTLATAGADKVVKVWDAVEGGQKKTISGFKGEITSVRYLGLENRMVIGTGRGQIHSRDSEGNGKKGFGKLTDYVHRVSSSRDGKVVAAAGSDRVVRVWDSEGKQLAEFK